MTESPYFSNPPAGLDLSESRTETNNAIGIALFIIAVIAVILRTIARLRFQKVSLEADDFFMYAGLFFGIGNLACCIAGGYYGLGKHIWSLGPHEMEKISVITFAYVFIYAWSVTMIKFSILLFYRRIFGMTWLAWWCVFLTTGYLIANHVVLPLYCKPLPYYWLQWHNPEGGHCPVDEADFYLGIGIINLIGDVSILSVPAPAVWKLQMPRMQKIAILFVFLLGSFVCIASGIRIKVIVALTKTMDISWAKSDVFIWSSVEPSVGIVSGCLPTLRGLIVWALEQCGLGAFVGGFKQRGHNSNDDSDSNERLDGGDKAQRPKGRSSLFNSGGGHGKLRSDDEVCLTTVITTKGKSTSSVDTGDDTQNPNNGGIHVYKQFHFGDH